MDLTVTHNPALTISIALAAGMAAQAIARHLRVPGIVLLLAVGVLLGPEVAGLVRPSGLGSGLQRIVGMSVAVILFEGGLNLDIRRLQKEAKVLRRLVMLGAVLTGLGAALAAHLVMGWNWTLSALFGSLVIVTGPTVMTPLLRRIDVKEKVHTILEGEGVLLDPVGAVIAVVTLELLLPVETVGGHSSAVELLGLPARLVLGTMAGTAGGLVIGALFRHRDLVPSGLENVLVLSFVLVVFEVSESMQAESGIMAAAVAGIVVGNMGTHIESELKEFKEQLTVLLIGLLFVLLAATVRLEAVANLGLRGAATIAVVMVVVRPVSVAVCSLGSDLDLRERLFVSWLAPRGIVAAAIASVVAQSLSAQGIPGGEELQALVFLVIAATVLIQGGTGPWVASALGVRRPAPSGWAIVGADALSRALARVLTAGGEDVVLIDSNPGHCRAAEQEGLPVVYGDATNDRTYRQAGIRFRRGVAATTLNPALNLLVLREFEDRGALGTSSVALDRRSGDVGDATVRSSGHEVLFAHPVDLDEWRHGFRHGLADVGEFRWEGDAGPAAEVLKGAPRLILPLAVCREGKCDPVTDRSRIRPGDRVYFAWKYADGVQAGDWFREAGWTPVARPVE